MERLESVIEPETDRLLAGRAVDNPVDESAQTASP